MTPEASYVAPYLPAIFGLVGVIIGGAITAIVQFILMSRRIDADVKLAKQKFDLELQASRHKRKQELAEEILVGFYEFKDIMHFVKSPMNFASEGNTRLHADGETADESKAKDNYFIQLERMDRNSEKLATFFSRQNRAVAWLVPTFDCPSSKSLRSCQRLLLPQIC